MKLIGQIGLVLSCFLLFGCTSKEDRVESRVVEPAKPAVNMPSPTGGAEEAKAPGSGDSGMGGSMGAGMGAGSVPPPEVNASAYSWKNPTGWQVGQASQFRIASFNVPGDGTQVHSASIVVLSGAAGGIVDNVNRWRGQVGLPQVGEKEILASGRKDKCRIGSFQWFTISDKNNTAAAMLAAIIPAGEETVFVKLTATQAVIEKNKDKFLALARSLARKASGTK